MGQKTPGGWESSSPWNSGPECNPFPGGADTPTPFPSQANTSPEITSPTQLRTPLVNLIQFPKVTLREELTVEESILWKGVVYSVSTANYSEGRGTLVLTTSDGTSYDAKHDPRTGQIYGLEEIPVCG